MQYGNVACVNKYKFPVFPLDKSPIGPLDTHPEVIVLLAYIEFWLILTILKKLIHKLPASTQVYDVKQLGQLIDAVKNRGALLWEQAVSQPVYWL